MLNIIIIWDIDGEGVSKDAMEAVRVYRMAANQGNAQNWLEKCYENGWGVSKMLLRRKVRRNF